VANKNKKPKSVSRTTITFRINNAERTVLNSSTTTTQLQIKMCDKCLEQEKLKNLKRVSTLAPIFRLARTPSFLTQLQALISK